MFCTIIELAITKFPDFPSRNKPKVTAFIFLQVVNSKSQLLTSTIDGYFQSLPIDVYRMTHTDAIQALASLLSNKCTENASNKDFIRINGRFSITALDPATSKWSASPSSSHPTYRSHPIPNRSPPNHRNYEKYNISAFDYDPSLDQLPDHEVVDDFDYGLMPDDQGVSAIALDTELEATHNAFLNEEDTTGFDYDTPIAAVATRRSIQKRPELCYQYYWHLIGKCATGCSAGTECPRIHNPELRDTFKTLVQHNAVPPPQQAIQSTARGTSTSPSRNTSPRQPQQSAGVRFQAPREPH